MTFPWTSRERLVEAQSQIAELKAEVKTLREKNDYLNNQIVWRLSGVALDPNTLPEHYRPKATTIVQATDDGQREPIISGSAPMRARQVIKEAEKKREQEFLRSIGIATSSPTLTPEEQKIQTEALAKLNQSANEGMRDAAKTQEA